LKKINIINEFEFFYQNNEKENNYKINEVVSNFEAKDTELFYLEDKNINFEGNIKKDLIIVYNTDFEILNDKNNMQQVKKIMSKKIEVKFGGRYFSK
jgi:hypothetical protein